MTKNNPLIEAYLESKFEDIEKVARDWVHVLRIYYDVAIEHGFTKSQAMSILGMLWERTDEQHRRTKGE